MTNNFGKRAREEGAVLHINVSGLAGHVEPAVEATRDTTLGQLRQMICETHPVGRGVSLTLMQDGEELLTSMDGLTLPACGVDDGAALTVVRRYDPRVLTASGDRTAKIWSATTGECLHTLSGHERFVYLAVYSADRDSVLTASADNSAKIWSASTGECLQTLSGHSNFVWSAEWSADGVWVLTASADSTAKIWSTTDGQCLRTLSEHAGHVNSAAFAPAV